MSAALPEIDNPNSFVVDDGEAVGPLSLREIVESILASKRPEDAFVWWVGAGDWVRFNSEPALLKMLEQVSAEGAEVSNELVEEPESPEPEEPEAAIEEVDEVEPAPEVVAVEEVGEIDLREQTLEDEQQQDEQVLPEISVVKETGLAALTALGERLEALASATRLFAASSKLDRAGATPIGRQVLLENQPPVVFPDMASDIRATNLATRFDSVLRQSVNYERLSVQSHRVIELLARACAAAFTRHGYTIERSSEAPGYHHLVFVNNDGVRHSQLTLRPAASVGGGDSQYVAIQMQWGQAPSDLDEAGNAAEAANDLLPVTSHSSGTISAELDLESSLASTSIDLVWSVGEYVGPDFELDHEALQASLDSLELALENRWHELFTAAE